jgi:hypothetical protein
VRTGGLTVRTMFITYLVLIAAGIAFFSVIGLIHN